MQVKEIIKILKEEYEPDDFLVIGWYDYDEFEGIVKKITKPNLFKPDNDIKNNIWYSLKLEDLENFTVYKLNNFVLFLQNSQNNLVENKNVSPDLPNNHLKYAITWYSVALSILLYFLYFRKKQ